MAPTGEDLELLERSRDPGDGGIALFTSYFFATLGKRPNFDLVGLEPGTYEVADDMYVPWVPLPWQFQVAHAPQTDITVIGSYGCGKTSGIAAILTYYAAIYENFNGLVLAPTEFQAKQSYTVIRRDFANWDDRDLAPTRLSHLISDFRLRPLAVQFWNGSLIEFRPAANSGRTILTWSGDVVVIDEAGQVSQAARSSLDELIQNAGSRTRGHVGGRVRLGKLIVVSTADPDPTLWERYDLAQLDPESYLSLRVTIDNNPYLTATQKDTIRKRIFGDERVRQYLYAERPEQRSTEFPPSLLDRCRDNDLDGELRAGIEDGLDGYISYTMRRAGVVAWQIPPKEGHEYILVGDPGQGTPPDRNSAVVIVIDITDFPRRPASLASFRWIDGNGSYWPFIQVYKEMWATYRPTMAGYDATGTQKGFGEMAFSGDEILAEPIDFATQKPRMVNYLKLLMDRGLIQLPGSVKGIWLQLSSWRMPDRGLRNDIVSALFMAAYLLGRLVLLDEQGHDDVTEPPQYVRPYRADNSRPWRSRKWPTGS